MSIRENLQLKANARIDGRQELIHKLGLTANESITDEELILHAYEAWGTDCVKYLIGDFAFAISDGQQLFCARDHFGVKPFFYTHVDGNFNFSSTLNELRGVSNTLNEIAVGDYLLFGVNQDNSTTIFGDIQRLPPGHTLTVANNEIKVRCYWTPSLPAEVRFRDSESYVERFSELFSRAVKDRLRTDRVAISMSGGLDSTSLAAIACEHTSVAGFTVVYDKLIPDEERHYSTLAGEHLGIPVTHLNADRYSLFDGEMDQPEPFLVSALTGQFNDLLRLCAEFSSVALTGYDGDALMHEPEPASFRIKTRIRRMLRSADLLPEWVDESFAKQTNLQERWEQFWSNRVDAGKRPAAMRTLNSKIWTSLFEGYDRGATKLNLDVRHPFLDIRLIEYLLAIPTKPWCVNKHILRRAMSNKLPTAVLNRPKTGLKDDPAVQLVQRASVRWLDSFEVSPQLRAFVNLNRRRPVAEERTSDALWASLRVFALNYWLTNSQSKMETMHGT
ncbi:MAG TPA: asparagine synthase-related protein [Pyrinomonadaceae bacterium]|nr:asparagine synthase-related protein [Pyrinomonadaceae bacterium]